FSNRNNEGDTTCPAVTSRATPTSRNARPSISRKATRSAASARRNPSGAPGQPATRKSAAATRAAPAAQSRTPTSRRTSAPGAATPDAAVEAVFATYPSPVKSKLLALRRLIFDTAKTTAEVGALQEALKWGQPSYLTTESKSGSTIRIDQVKAEAGQYAVYF